MTEEGRTFTFAFTFKTSGSSLSGVVELLARERSFPITEGTIHGTSISFKAFGLWTGTIRDDGIALTRELDGGKKQRMLAHRSPKKQE